MSDHPCKDECMRLIALSNHMSKVFEAPSTQNDTSLFASWRKRADALLVDPQLESLAGEQKIDNLSLDLRRRWLQHAHLRSDGYLMSPPHKQRKLLPGDERIPYPYDRWIKPAILEKRLDDHRGPPEGWISDTCVFANGMGAFNTFLQVYRAYGAQFWDRAKTPLSVHWFGGYFEFSRSLELICDGRFAGRKYQHQQDLCNAVKDGQTDLILIEPVVANVSLEVFDMEAFCTAWSLRPKGQPAVIMIDTSMCANAFPIEQFCKKLGDNPPSLVVGFRSGLKLDQYGLELSNLGLMTLWSPESDANQNLLRKIAKAVRLARTTFGVSLSQDECAALQAPFILDKTALTNHSQDVFANNKKLALALNDVLNLDAGLFHKVNHPTLSPDEDKPWAVAPYINLRYRSDDQGDRAFLRAVIESIAFERKLSFVSGSSFGFRSHRFEMGFVRGVKFSSLRVAMGSRAGPSLDGIIEMFKELAAFENFEALRAAYPEIDAQRPKDRLDEES